MSGFKMRSGVSEVAPPPVIKNKKDSGTIISRGNKETNVGSSSGFVSAVSYRLKTVNKNTNLHNNDLGSLIEIDATKNSVNIVLPQASSQTSGKSIMFRRKDSTTNEALFSPYKGDTIEKGAPSGSWIPGIGGCFGVGFGDFVSLCSDGYKNWFFISRPRIETITLQDDKLIKMHDLDRIVVVTCDDEENLVILPESSNISGRVLHIKNSVTSLSDVVVKGYTKLQQIDGYQQIKVRPGDALMIVCDDNGNWHVLAGFYYKEQLGMV